jgi:hypothetical protein
MVGANLSLAVTGTMGPRTEQARAMALLRTGGSALGEVSSLSSLVFCYLQMEPGACQALPVRGNQVGGFGPPLYTVAEAGSHAVQRSC